MNGSSTCTGPPACSQPRPAAEERLTPGLNRARGLQVVVKEGAESCPRAQQLAELSQHLSKQGASGSCCISPRAVSEPWCDQHAVSRLQAH